jgi:hypothetical protein
LALKFGFPGTVAHPDAGTGLAVGLQEAMQVALEDQTPVVLKGLEESARETGILTLPHLWVTVVVLVNYTQTKPIHGQ